MHSALYEGSVRHRRFRPVEHVFDFPLFMLYLDLDELESPEGSGLPGWPLFSTRRAALAWFRRADHPGSPETPLSEALRERVAQARGQRPEGPIRVLTHLRYAGFVFNPVSFFYCFDRLGALDAVVAHITNTPWGETHSYVLDAKGVAYEHEKEFHVSPFMPMKQRYRWRLLAPEQRLGISVQSLDAEPTPLFDVTLRMRRRPLSARTLAGRLLRYPLLTAQVVVGIYWQALRLWLAGADFHPHPRHAAPSEVRV